MRMRGLFSGAVGFAAGGLCVLSVLGAPAGAASSSPAAKFWRENAPTATPVAAESLPSLAPLVKAVSPSVVNIFTTQKTRNPHAGIPGFNFGPFGFNAPGGGDDDDDGSQGGGMPNEIESHALGSGFIVSSDGYIVTNNHVVAKADEIRVKLTDGRELPARIIGRDAQIDIGLIKIEAKDLPTVSLGDSDRVETGDWVLAMGNPLGLDHAASAGIISGLGRNIGIGRYDALLQTDAAINPGNSGGPLFNLKGEVVGINTAIVGGANNIGFAIPINMAKEILLDLKEHGKAIRGQLGVLLRPLDPEKKDALGLSSTDGALVERVLQGSPAEKAGLKPGDVITKYDGTPVKEVKELQRAVARTRPGADVPLVYVRNGKPAEAKARVIEYREEAVAAASSGSPEPGDSGKLGVAVSPLTPELSQRYNVHATQGVLVRGVKRGSPAEQAGVEEGDVILEANHRKISSPDEFREVIKSAGAKGVLLLVERDDGTHFLVVGAAH